MQLKFGLFLASLVVWASADSIEDAPVVDRRADKRPNIVFIFTDDQDHRLNSLQYMGGVQEHLINQGAIYQHHYCTVALCCPSRANLWSGRAAHNTNVTDLAPPYGGYQKFAKKYNDNWLPLWMNRAGYLTYYVGKLMNSFNETNYDDPTPSGFNGSDFLCGGGTYNYFTPTFQRNINGNPQPPKKYPNQYTTDLTFNKSMAFLDDARKAGGPFFLTMATVAPHHGTGKRVPGDPGTGPVPQEKYIHLFNDISVPNNTANFNPDKPSGTSWLLQIDQLSKSELANNDNYYRNRLRALQSVDELVNGTIAYLTQHNLLDNTYIIYSSDNGFHISQHRLFPGKNCPYEEDINVPLIIRGPGIKAGSTVSVATTHTDLAPTILEMAGVQVPSDIDGSAVPMVAANVLNENFEHAQVEHWGDAGSDDQVNYPGADVKNTTYKALRVIGNGYNYYYSVWCTNQRELYNMTVDSYQMQNLYQKYTYQPNEPSSNPWSLNRLESRLDALLLVLKSCKAGTCTKPWLALHPQGDVSTLVDAMNPKYDEFYEKQQNRVSFSECKPGYLTAFEGPQTFLQYQSLQNRMASPGSMLF